MNLIYFCRRVVLVSVTCFTLTVQALAQQVTVDRGGRLGGVFTPVEMVGNNNSKSAGLQIKSLLPNGTLSSTSIEVGDTIYQVDGREFDNAEAFANYIRSKAPSESIQIIYYRAADQKHYRVTVPMAAAPQSAATAQSSTPNTTKAFIDAKKCLAVAMTMAAGAGTYNKAREKEYFVRRVDALTDELFAAGRTLGLTPKESHASLTKDGLGRRYINKEVSLSKDYDYCDSIGKFP